jgi:predicted DNA-binding transcriptional regulator AlpA
MSYFFGGMEGIAGHRTGRVGRAAERASHTLFRALEAKQDGFVQPTGGGSADAPARAPRARRTSARTPASGDDGDSDGEPARRSLPPHRFYDLPTVAHVVSLSTGNVQALVRAGDFPKPRALSARRVGWLAREIDEWAESRPVAKMLPPVNAGMRNAMPA